MSERIPTNLRVLRILEVLGLSDRPMTPTEINRELGLPKQTIHRLCTTLENEGYLVRETNGKRYQPSGRVKNIAAGILYNSRSQIATRQVLIGVAAAIKETVNLVIPEDNGMMYLDRIETDWAFRIQLPVGSQVPFHCTASGKTFLASMTRSARERVVSGLMLESHTPNTFVDRERLLLELAKIAKQGYAIDNEEFMQGMVALAVPILDSRSRYCAALAFHGPTQRLSMEHLLSKRQLLKTASEQLSQTLFR